MKNKTIKFKKVVNDMKLSREEKSQIEAYKNYYQALVNLRSYRQKIGLSQDDLAMKSGIPKSTISKIENGKRNATLDTIIVLASAMGKKVEIKLV